MNFICLNFCCFRPIKGYLLYESYSLKIDHFIILSFYVKDNIFSVPTIYMNKSKPCVIYVMEKVLYMIYLKTYMNYKFFKN